MKILRSLTVFAMITAATAAFGATVTGLTGTATYNGNPISNGDTIPDGATIDLLSGTIQVQGTINVNAGNGVSSVSGGEMLVEVRGDLSRTAAYDGIVSFTPKGKPTQSILVGQELFGADAGADTLIIIENINAIDLPGFEDIPPVVGTPT